MKILTRALVFSGMSLIFTSYFIHGFILSYNLKSFVAAALILAIVYYIIQPVTKLVLLPLNLLTLGLVSLIVNILIFYLVLSTFHIATIVAWNSTAIHTSFFTFPTFHFTFWASLAAASMLYSFFINLLHKIL